MKELYFDISSPQSGGSLYRISDQNGIHFYYNHSTYNDKTDEVEVFDTTYIDFMSFWKYITQDPQGFYLHPLFVHPEQRDFIREELKKVNWNIFKDKKWQESHQRQWKKVLEGRASYYKGPE